MGGARPGRRGRCGCGCVPDRCGARRPARRRRRRSRRPAGPPHRARCRLRVQPVRVALAATRGSRAPCPLLLELLGIPFTGSPPEVLSFALRKDRVKQRLEAAGIPTPAGRILSRPDEACDLPFPLIVKPVREDGSVGIWRTSVVHAAGELARAVEAVVTTFRQPALVEQFIDGRELNVALIGHPDTAGPAAERDRLHRPAGGRAAHRLLRREVDDRLGRRPRARCPSCTRSCPTRWPPGSGAPRPRPSVPSGSATTAGSTSGSRPAASRTWST